MRSYFVGHNLTFWHLSLKNNHSSSFDFCLVLKVMDIKITFVNPIERHEQVTLSWKLVQNQAVLVWYNLFILNLENPEKKLFSRFSGFVNSSKNISKIVDELNRCITIVDNHGTYPIKERCPKNYSQEDLNAIHHHFEILSTSKWKDFILTAPAEITAAIRGINYFIHDLEVHTRNLKMKQNDSKDGAVAVLFEFRQCDRLNLPDSFNSFFHLEREFGDMVLHYSQVGKTWIEAFWDKDEIIFNEAIRPLEILTGEMDIIFAKFKLEGVEKEAFHQFLRSHNKGPNDPTLRLGHLKVASFNDDLNLAPWEYEALISKHSDIASIEVLNEDKRVLYRTFSDSTKIF
jgi:hypothetical protein